MFKPWKGQAKALLATDAPRAQNNLSKLLTALSAITAPVHIFGKGAGAWGSDENYKYTWLAAATTGGGKELENR